MDLLVHFAHSISPLAAGLLLTSVWQGLLLTVAVALAMRAAPAISPAGRTRIWTAVLVLIVLLPLLDLLIPHGAPPPHGQLHLAQDWSVGLLTLWIACASVRGAALAANAFRLDSLARRAVPLPVPESLVPLLRGPRQAVLCASGEVNRPSVAGFFHPRVLLPEGLLETLSPAELEHVVLHEMEHLRRRDDWMNLLQQISLVLLPLNPALFWLDRRLCCERELACDDGVLAATHAHKAYAACLVKLAEDSLVRKGIALALSALGTRARESELMERVRRILAGPEKIAFTGGLISAAATLGIAAVAVAAMLARSPQWVSFDAVAPAAMAQTAVQTQILPPFFPARMIPASARRNAALPGPVMISTALQRPGVACPRMITAVQPKKSPVRIIPVKTFSHSLRRAVAEPGPWSTMPVGAVAYRSPQADVPPYSPARFVVTEYQASQTIFAAVPVRGGWLILQL